MNITKIRDAFLGGLLLFGACYVLRGGAKGDEESAAKPAEERREPAVTAQVLSPDSVLDRQAKRQPDGSVEIYLDILVDPGITAAEARSVLEGQMRDSEVKNVALWTSRERWKDGAGMHAAVANRGTSGVEVVYQLPAPPLEPPDIGIAYKVAKLSGGAGSFTYSLIADVSEGKARAALERFAAAVRFPEGGSLSACLYADEARRAADEELACLYSSAEGVSVNGPDDPVDW